MVSLSNWEFPGSRLEEDCTLHAPAARDMLLVEERKEQLEQVLKRLRPRPQYIIRCLYGIGEPRRSVRKLSEELQVSRQRIYQIRDRELRRLRKRLEGIEL